MSNYVLKAGENVLFVSLNEVKWKLVGIVQLSSEVVWVSELGLTGVGQQFFLTVFVTVQICSSKPWII